ncbi:hypothetical protein [Pukyongiella litopenaei]|uniref:Uncharacterized protein n=1 Tax=Pukyongiella litopenaei TaxID=2605946 RepID=A0A2S0MUQ5_9RHOB|nr:hypothetical protein [Pukyongiella litopenaei]AVO39605.1 hypothetical protein C6Y53_02065 [Pukyongiella litopenaei]
MIRFKVMRRHIGDRMYDEGDERVASETEVRHLVERGVLMKMEPKPKNKAVRAAPRNKRAG